MSNTGNAVALHAEIEELKSRLNETEETLRAIRNGEVDAIVVSGEKGEKNSLALGAAILGTWDYVKISKGLKITWSDQMCRLFGVLPGEKITEELISSRIHADDRKKAGEDYRKSIENHTQYESEYRVIWPDNSIHWIHATGKVMINEEPGIDFRATGIANDITIRKKAELELKESEERYRLLSDTMTQGVIHRDSEGKIVFINPAGERILGVNSSELLGKRHEHEMYQEDGKLIDSSEHPSEIALRTGLYSIGDIVRIYNSREDKYRWLSIDTMPLFRKNQTRPYQVYSVFEDITERRQAEREILRREKLLRSAFDEGSVPMTITSREGIFLRINHAFCKLTGYSEEDLKKMTYQQLTYPDDMEASIRGRDELEKGERTSFRLEKRYIRKDGRIVWVSISSAPVQDDEGNWDYFVTHVQDINKRKVAENRLKESKERFRQLANSIPQLAWIGRSDGYIFWFNHRWYEYTGKTPNEMIGWGWKDVYDPLVSPSILSDWKSLIATGRPFEMINSLLGKDGNFREFLTKTIPIRDKKGLVEQWFGTHTDISELKKVENELKESREKLNIALENGKIGTWEWDLRTNEVIWDERMEKMFGLEPGTFGGTYNDFESLVHEEDLPHMKKALEDALEFDKPYETVYRTNPVYGVSNFISSKGLVTKDREGKPLNMAGVCFDVTGMKQGTEQVLLRLNEDLLRSNMDLQQFAYVASHDLQEPLRMVSSFTQLLELRYGDKLDEDGKEYIHYAVEGSKRMYELLNGLLAYSRIQTRGKEFTEVSMNDVLQKVIENLSLIVNETGAHIDISSLPVIMADESQMIQLIQNLIENSIKFSHGIPEITISARKNNDQHIFSVKDKGIGIEPQYFERIFRIFQRLHRSEEYEGTGIGLAICKRIVERHGGKIWIESAYNEGATFYFSLPVMISKRST
jgi:PAS domain S-box-containing protein